MASPHDSNGRAGYPKRDQCFAHKYCRLLTKSAAAQDLGPEVCWLLTVIAHQEDAAYYKRAVTFYNEQLMPLLGIGGRSRLVHARRRAVDKGWLHYEPGAKGVPGKYWTLVPEAYADMPDGPCDESDAILNQDDNSDSVPNQDGNQDGKQDGNQDGNQDGKPAPFFPSPPPNPTPKESVAQNATPANLLLMIDGWNSLRAEGLVEAAARRDPPAKAVLNGWKRLKREPELRDCFEDIPALLEAIRRATFCHRAGWFTLAKLFGKNRDGELIARKILDGGYRDDGRQRTQRPGAGQKYGAESPYADVGRM